MKRVYIRCTSAHIFELRAPFVCPRDGWSYPGMDLVGHAAERLTTDGHSQALTLAALRDEGVPEEALRRVLVIEFGSNALAFDDLWWAAYHNAGRWYPSSEADSILRYARGQRKTNLHGQSRELADGPEDPPPTP